MVRVTRWNQAQVYERSYWQKTADRIASGSTGQLGWYEWRANEMDKKLASLFDAEDKKNARALEIGSGPIGIMTYLNWGDRYTIDPLEEFYRSNPVLSKMRSTSVKYGQGTGERLPFQEHFFMLVILDNVLDHVQDASGVLKEIHRVLSPKGLLYFNVNVHTPFGGVLHSVLSNLKIDKGHPHTFTASSIQTFLRRHKFRILREWIGDFYAARAQDRKSSKLKDQIKGYSGLSEFIYGAICSKFELP